ncbi:ABC transporter ATP-binding protein [Clostridium sporogenes]|nr:ABC transporter ATP-binding protein [Clostridium sporogenes]NFS26328.1 ABC transporter ATP-binding protein [Clostridium sporogenes]
MEKQSNPMTRLLEFTAPYKGSLIFSVVLAILGVMIGFIPYFAVAGMVVDLLNGKVGFQNYKGYCVAIIAGYIVKTIFLNLSTSVSHTLTFKTLRDIRKLLMSKLERIPMGDVLDTPSGKLKDTIVDRVEGLETTLAHLLPEMTANILVPILLVVYLFTIDWRMALISLITLPIGMLFVVSMSKSYAPKYKKSVEINKRMNSSVVEYINGIEVIKAFNQSAKSYRKFTDSVVENASFYYKWMKSCQKQMASYTAICPAVLITVLPIGFVFYANGSLASNDFITIIILSMGIAGPIINASNFIDSIATMGTVVSNAVEILEKDELIRPNTKADVKGTKIELKDVVFAYHLEDKTNVLNGVDLSIEEGQVTALVGPSGSGKSTITKLIAGFWDVTSGKITIGGFELKKIPQRQLADMIAYVSQDNYLFDDTIRENIRMGKKGATDRDVVEVAKKAGCHAFIMSLEKGYDTVVGGAGGHLSGGERQRIAIARAMLKDAPIVILDEATAYIDPENEAVIQQAVSKLVAKKTLIVIAHRLSTVVDSDKIVVVENGHIVKSGKHKELLTSCELYNEMWKAHIGAKDGDVK